MKTFSVFATNGNVIPIKAEYYEIDKERGCLHFVVKNRLISSFVTSNIVGVIEEDCLDAYNRA